MLLLVLEPYMIIPILSICLIFNLLMVFVSSEKKSSWWIKLLMALAILASGYFAIQGRLNSASFSKYYYYSRLTSNGSQFLGSLSTNTNLSDYLKQDIRIDAKSNGEYSRFIQCSENAVIKFQNVTKSEPNFPFTWWALAFCYKQDNKGEWVKSAEKAKEILDITTSIQGHTLDHELAQVELKKLIKNK